MDKFEEVVHNAFDFLKRSIEELESKRIKYSVIHFYSAVELLLKARLLKEHWALIVVKPENADLKSFLEGEFQSVGMKDAALRLTNIIGQGLSDAEKDCFTNLGKHRNKMVHFTHVAQGKGNAAKKMLEEVVSEQAKGWFHLRQLLEKRWSGHFFGFLDEIQDIDMRMRKHAVYLSEKFKLLAPEMARQAKAGYGFADCPSCFYKAFRWNPPSSVGEGICQVCELSDTTLSFKCLNCKAPTFLSGHGWGKCVACGAKYEPSVVSEVLEAQDLLKFLDPTDQDEPSTAGCIECDTAESLRPLPDGWFCTHCFILVDDDEVGACESCGGYSTGVPENSSWAGCMNCEGRAGHYRDD